MESGLDCDMFDRSNIILVHNTVNYTPISVHCSVPTRTHWPLMARRSTTTCDCGVPESLRNRVVSGVPLRRPTMGNGRSHQTNQIPRV